MRLFLIITLLLAFILTSCSFESKQLNAISSFLKRPNTEIPAPNWMIYWYGEENPIYAINDENSIVFANELNQVIAFKDDHISRIIGVLPNGSDLRIEKDNELISYYQDNTLIRSDECSFWYSSSLSSNNVTRSFQNCFFKNTSSYQNTILFLESGDEEEKKIIGLKYKIHPQYPHIMLKMKSYLDEEF